MREVRIDRDYLVREDGTVWSTRLPGAPRLLRGKAPTKTLAYRRVSLGQAREVTVHRLVAEAFLGPCPDGHEVRHLNGDKLDNRICNLAYGPRSQNVLDTYIHRRGVGRNHGPRHHWAKLTTDQVEAIRERRSRGEVLASLSREFGVCQSAISMIANHSRRAHA